MATAICAYSPRYLCILSSSVYSLNHKNMGWELLKQCRQVFHKLYALTISFHLIMSHQSVKEFDNRIKIKVKMDSKRYSKGLKTCESELTQKSKVLRNAISVTLCLHITKLAANKTGQHSYTAILSR